MSISGKRACAFRMIPPGRDSAAGDLVLLANGGQAKGVPLQGAHVAGRLEAGGRLRFRRRPAQGNWIPPVKITAYSFDLRLPLW